MLNVSRSNTGEIIHLAIGCLRPHEHYVVERAALLAEEISRIGVWTTPIAVERGTGCILDGHHRLAAARALSLQSVPCVLFDHGEVSVESRRADVVVTAEIISARSLAGELFPPKTTRHRLPAHGGCRVPLAMLRRGGGG